MTTGLQTLFRVVTPKYIYISALSEMTTRLPNFTLYLNTSYIYSYVLCIKCFFKIDVVTVVM